MPKKHIDSLAQRKTTSFLDGMTDEEREAAFRKEEADARSPSKPYGRRDVANRARSLARHQPDWIAEDIKLEETEDGQHVVLVSVGPSCAGIVDKYACVYLSALQLDKLYDILSERYDAARRDHPSEPRAARKEAHGATLATHESVVEEDLP